MGNVVKPGNIVYESGLHISEDLSLSEAVLQVRTELLEVLAKIGLDPQSTVFSGYGPESDMDKEHAAKFEMFESDELLDAMDAFSEEESAQLQESLLLAKELKDAIFFAPLTGLYETEGNPNPIIYALRYGRCAIGVYDRATLLELGATEYVEELNVGDIALAEQARLLEFRFGSDVMV